MTDIYAELDRLKRERDEMLDAERTRDQDSMLMEAQIDDLTRERDALAELLSEAREEMRLIRMKDCGAVYDPTLRIRMDQALAQVRK